MKNIFKYSIIVLVYLILGTIFWGNQEYMLPTFIAIFIVINLYLIDPSKNYFTNLIHLSGICILAFLISFLTEDANTFLVVQYISTMLVSSFLIFYLKKNKKNTHTL